MSADETRICARLIREGAVPRTELPELEHPELRARVEERLDAVGLELATSAYSEHYAVRLAPSVTGEEGFEDPSNVRFRADACALLVVLWSRLVLQKRTAALSRTAPEQPQSLFAEENAKQARAYVPQVRLEALVREFPDLLPSVAHAKRVTSSLQRLGFVRRRRGMLEAGPFLELGIDGETMIAFLKRGVLQELLQEPEKPREPEQDDPGTRLLKTLEELGGEVGIRELAETTGQTRSRLRRLLTELREEGRIDKVGERTRTRYRLREVLADGEGA